MYKKYYKIVERYMDDLLNNITMSDLLFNSAVDNGEGLISLLEAEGLISLLEALEKVEFDDYLTDKAELIFSTSVLSAEYPYVLPLEIYKHTMRQRVNERICNSFYQYIAYNGWDEEGVIIKGMLCEGNLKDIRAFCLEHNFADLSDSYFMDKPIWKGKNYELVLKKYGVSWKDGL